MASSIALSNLKYFGVEEEEEGRVNNKWDSYLISQSNTWKGRKETGGVVFVRDGAQHAFAQHVREQLGRICVGKQLRQHLARAARP